MKNIKLFWIMVVLLCCGTLVSCGGNSDLGVTNNTSAGTPTNTPEDVTKSSSLPAKTIIEDEQYKKDVEEDEELIQKGAIARIDYPLIDIYFEKNKNYKIVLRELYSDDNKIHKEYADTGNFFQYNKEKFSILTVPSGLGTTLDYVLEVYEEDVCIKTIECSQIRTDFFDDAMRK